MELFYRKVGDGPQMIIVHGLYGMSDNWMGIAKAFSSDFEVFVVDQRNHGQSPHSDEHNYDQMAGDLLEFMDKHEIAQAVLVGHSMGGKTVMHFALKYPERVSRLVVVDIAPKSYLGAVKKDPAHINHDQIVAAMQSIDLSKAQNRQDVDDQMAEQLTDARIRNFLMKNLTRDEDKQFVWRLNLPVLARSLDFILNGVDAAKFKPGTKAMGFPALFIRGANSGYLKPEDITLTKKVFPYADLVTVPDAGHWVHAEQPDLLTKTIGYFVLE